MLMVPVLDRDAYGDRDAYRLPEPCLTVMLMVTVDAYGAQGTCWHTISVMDDSHTPSWS